MAIRAILENKWRKRVGVEPTGDGIARRPPVLKTGTITGPHALPQDRCPMLARRSVCDLPTVLICAARGQC
jgi:hypothetical protein